MVNKIETLYNIKDSNSLLATVARAMGLQLLLSDKLPALFLIMGAITVTIILSGKKKHGLVGCCTTET